MRIEGSSATLQAAFEPGDVSLSLRTIQHLKEKDLIQGCIREDQSCQKYLFEHYAPKMFTVCRRYARHHMEAEDMLQDGFVNVFDNIKQF